MRVKTINLMGIVVLVLSLWLGFSGRVDWWVIVLIWLSQSEIAIDLAKARGEQ